MKVPMTYTVWAGDTCLYVGCTEHLGRRLTSHSNTKPWWATVTRVETESHESIEVARVVEGHLLAELAPKYNAVLHYIRPPKGAPSLVDSDLLPIGEAARILGVSVETIRRWDRDGKLASTRTLGGQRRFRRATVEALAEPAA